jgi:hypothetical protein
VHVVIADLFFDFLGVGQLQPLPAPMDPRLGIAAIQNPNRMVILRYF